MSTSGKQYCRELIEDLSKLSASSILSIPPGGNLGDILIYTGFDNLVDEAKVGHTDFRRTIVRSGFLEKNVRGVPFRGSVTELSMFTHDILVHTFYLYHRLFSDPDVVYIHGGGHLNDMWGIGMEAVRIADAYFDSHIIVGPASCNFEESDPRPQLQAIDNPLSLYCREKYSYDVMSRILEEVDDTKLKMTDDTALALTPEDFDIASSESEYTLMALRTDKESALSTRHFEVDYEKNLVQDDVSITASNVNEFASRIANAAKIHTDRLHVALTASIFDIPTTFYGNSYHKNRGVYEYSLADHPDIDFVQLE